jgi:hypothetical protein
VSLGFDVLGFRGHRGATEACGSWSFRQMNLGLVNVGPSERGAPEPGASESGLVNLRY